MKERPILFSGPMVRAILDGRKTQTRRVVKPQPFSNEEYRFNFPKPLRGGLLACNYLSSHLCPCGQPGDWLWVRETWCHEFEGGYLYRADDLSGLAPEFVDGDGNPTGRSGWKPSIHMPRAASRITLEITGVRVERLQEISEDDAIAEGVVGHEEIQPASAYYRELWESINGHGSWDANPWVWVVEFRRFKP